MFWFKSNNFLNAAILLLSLFPVIVAAAEKPRITSPQVEAPTRVLFVGNSYMYYNDSLHNHVRRLVAHADSELGENLKYKSATIGGAALAHHNIKHLMKPGQIGVKDPFQLVILQGGSSAPLSERRRTQFRDKVKEFDKVIKRQGGRTALYMTPAYVKPHKRTDAKNIHLTEALYVTVGNEVDALVIPVGLAFEEAYRRQPDIQLHKDFDGSHPDLFGTYLAACTVYASIYGKSPVGNSYDYYEKIDRETAQFLQQVAVDTVNNFYGIAQ